MPKYKLLKVFNCQQMPGDIRDIYFEEANDPESHGNDCYIDWYIEHPSDPHISENKKIINQWLVDNGADAALDENSSGEKVLIRHWW